MLQILLHSSKTMSNKSTDYTPLSAPLFKSDATRLAGILRKTPVTQLAELMQISEMKAAEVKQLYSTWSDDLSLQLPAIDAFKGDIYSGLQVAKWSDDDRAYAHENLVILSGLYGALRACDGIMPYRLEMGYKLPSDESMYTFWGSKLAKIIKPETSHIINLSAVEYTKVLLPYVKQQVITPKFMTVSPKTCEPTFVTVHAKIARGAFARWLIQSKVDNHEKVVEFKDIGYRYDASSSTPKQPVFVCKNFQGIGLSVRLKAAK